MDIGERDRLAAAIIALRPDWACNGFDRLRTMRDWLSKNLMEWPFRDATVALVLVAIDPASNGPARIMTDGPWRTILRHLAGSVESNDPAHMTDAQLGGDCGICGVREAMHRGARIISDDIGPHEWIAAPSTTPASPATIARAKTAALSSKETEPMNAPSEAGERLPGHEDRDSAQVDPDAFVRVTPSAFHDASQA